MPCLPQQNTTTTLARHHVDRFPSPFLEAGAPGENGRGGRTRTSRKGLDEGNASIKLLVFQPHSLIPIKVTICGWRENNPLNLVLAVSARCQSGWREREQQPNLLQLFIPYRDYVFPSTHPIQQIFPRPITVNKQLCTRVFVKATIVQGDQTHQTRFWPNNL